MTFDGHRFNDFDTHVYVSEDAGDTWTSLAANLPDEPSFVVREDHRNEDLLFLGTEFGCYVSLDRGDHWLTLGTGLPTVAVRDLAIQDRDADLVAATHGRSIWVVDIAPLRTMTERLVKRTKDAHLFTPQDGILWRMRRDGRLGDKDWFAANPARGTTVYALFTEAPEKTPTLTIHNIEGQQVGAIKGEKQAGLQAFVWDTSRRRRGRGFSMRDAGPPVVPGSYSARLKWGDRELAEPFRMRPDPEPNAAHPAATPATSHQTDLRPRNAR